MKVKWWARYFSSSCGLTQRVTCQSLNSLFFFSVLGNFVHLLCKPLTLPLAYSLRGQSVQLVDGLMPSLPLSLLIMSPPLLSIIFSPTYFSPRYSLSPLYFIHTLHSSPFFSVIIPLFLPLIISSFLIICCSPPLRDSPPSLRSNLIDLPLSLQCSTSNLTDGWYLQCSCSPKCLSAPPLFFICIFKSSPFLPLCVCVCASGSLCLLIYSAFW